MTVRSFEVISRDYHARTYDRCSEEEAKALADKLGDSIIIRHISQEPTNAVGIDPNDPSSAHRRGSVVGNRAVGFPIE